MGYKVAIGYSKPVCALLALDLLGEGRETTIAALIDFVHEGRYFVGAREVCAGPTNMVERLGSAFMHGRAADASTVDPARPVVARTLASQLQLGMLWRRFDRRFEQRLLLHDLGREQLHPRNEFLSRRLDERLAEFARQAAPSATMSSRLCPPLPPTLPPALRRDGNAAVETAQGDGRTDTRVHDLAVDLLADGVGAIELKDMQRHDVFGRRFADYLVAYRAFVDAQCALERDIREALGIDASLPVALDSGIFPKAQTLNWFEVILGFRLRFDPPPLGPMTLRGLDRIAAVEA